MEKLTLREFITKEGLDPERNNDLDWYNPDKMILTTTIEVDGEPVYIFCDGATRCGIADTTTGSHSQLLEEDALNEFLKDLEEPAPNNLCVKERRFSSGDCLRWYPTLVSRYNYSEVDELSSHHTLAEAVEAGKAAAAQSKLPLTVSSKYLGRPETAGLKMF
jgi:hypothetical protein